MQDRRLGSALMALYFTACAAEARRATIDPRAQPTARFVVGRIEMFRDGQPQRITKSGAAALTSGPLTTLSLRNIASGERFAIPIENEQGWFAAQLPPGTYASGMQYYIWIFDTPARIQVPSDRQRCYLGTLDVNLFVRMSALGAWARTTGGAIPIDDIDFAIADQIAAAAAYAGALPGCPMSLARPAPGS